MIAYSTKSLIIWIKEIHDFINVIRKDWVFKYLIHDTQVQ